MSKRGTHVKNIRKQLMSPFVTYDDTEAILIQVVLMVTSN